MEIQLSNLGEMPDCRLVITFLWSEFHDVDTDGDSDNPASRSWTSFFCRNRSSPFMSFDIDPISIEPLILVLQSDDPEIAARVSLFLLRETGCNASLEGQPLDEEALIVMCGNDFDLDAALNRASISVWRKSTLGNPYPNLTD